MNFKYSNKFIKQEIKKQKAKSNLKCIPLENYSK